jgi:peptide/nickel transport system substrate-binding protein
LNLVSERGTLPVAPLRERDGGRMRRAWLTVALVPTGLLLLATAQATAAVKAKDTLVFAAAQDVNCFNLNLEGCNQFWAAVIAGRPVLRGVFTINPRLQYVRDLVSSARATLRPFAVTYDIRKNANWSDGTPVTAHDFVWSWQKIIDSRSQVAFREGYDQIESAKVFNKGKSVRFTFNAPYANWKDLFLSGVVLPKHVLRGEDYNLIWSNCVCNPRNGRPIGNGPYLLQSYRKGADATLVANGKWYGPKPKLRKIVFRFIEDTNSHIQAMRAREVDAAFPSPQTALTSLQRQSGLIYKSGPGLYHEHIDLAGKGNHNPLMDKAWFRQAVITGINRGGLVKTFFSDIAPSLKVLNSLVMYPPDANYEPHFNRYRYNPSKARQILTSHGCRAGADRIMVCGGVKAKILHATTGTNRRRVLAAQIYKDNLKAVGIEVDIRLVEPNVLFGDSPQGALAGNWDMLEYAWVTSPDSSFAVPWLGCGKTSNNMTYCNKKVTRLLERSDVTLNAKRRAALFNQANAIMAREVPSIPLYAVPVVLVHKTSVKGMGAPNPSFGPTWNAHLWSF